MAVPNHPQWFVLTQRSGGLLLDKLVGFQSRHIDHRHLHQPHLDCAHPHAILQGAKANRRRVHRYYDCFHCNPFVLEDGRHRKEQTWRCRYLGSCGCRQNTHFIRCGSTHLFRSLRTFHPLRPSQIPSRRTTTQPIH